LILVDTNLLLYAENSVSEHHETARTWWDEQLSGSEPVAVCWPVLTAFVRIGTNPRLHAHPLTLSEAIERVQSWLEQPSFRVIQPTEQHWQIFQRMLRAGTAVANLVSDAHLAALAVEHNCTLCTTDKDFSRFRGLKWKNPISS
jgi:toxin-antitoxin system PIN domain toxin